MIKFNGYFYTFILNQHLLFFNLAFDNFQISTNNNFAQNTKIKHLTYQRPAAVRQTEPSLISTIKLSLTNSLTTKMSVLDLEHNL